MATETGGQAAETLDAAGARAWVDLLAGPLGLTVDDAIEGVVDDGEAIDQIAALELVKNAASARQARLSVAFDRSQRARQRAAGVPTVRVGRGVAD